MIVNNKGVIIYEVGDVVMLTETRPDHWESGGAMDCYLGNVVTISSVQYPSGLGDMMTRSQDELIGTFNFSGSSHWSFRTDQIVCMATPELMAEVKAKKEKELAEFKERFKTCVFDPKEVFAIAKDVFGEEYVDLESVDKSEFNITVLFPEVQITNSRRTQHTMKDLYVRINIDITPQAKVGDRVSNITLYGRRGTLSEEEYQSNYGHSHFSGGGVERWSEFCLGNSDFAMIINTMKFSITQEDWMLLFLSLGNYVAWESIEGGPYKNIFNISLREQSLSSSGFNEHALELIKGLPSSCFTFDSKSIELNTDHPELLHYYNANSRIKSFRTGGSSASGFAARRDRFNEFVRREYRTFDFKGKAVVPKLYSKNTYAVEATEATEENIDEQVVEFYNTVIKKELKKYNIYHEYNKFYKDYHGSTIFRATLSF